MTEGQACWQDEVRALCDQGLDFKDALMEASAQRGGQSRSRSRKRSGSRGRGILMHRKGGVLVDSF